MFNYDDESIQIGFSEDELGEMIAKMEKEHLKKIQLLDDKLKKLSKEKNDAIINLYNSLDDDRFNESIHEVSKEDIKSMDENDLEKFLQSMHQEKQIKVKSKEDILQELEDKIMEVEVEIIDDGECEPYSEFENIPLKGSELENIKKSIIDETITYIHIKAGPNYTKIDNIFSIGFFDTKDTMLNLDFEVTKDVLEELYILLHNK